MTNLLNNDINLAINTHFITNYDTTISLNSNLATITINQDTLSPGIRTNFLQLKPKSLYSFSITGYTQINEASNVFIWIEDCLHNILIPKFITLPEISNTISLKFLTTVCPLVKINILVRNPIISDKFFISNLSLILIEDRHTKRLKQYNTYYTDSQRQKQYNRELQELYTKFNKYITDCSITHKADPNKKFNKII